MKTLFKLLLTGFLFISFNTSAQDCDSCRTDFYVSSTTMCHNEEITFFDNSSCAVEWHWNFGEGAKVAPSYLLGEVDGKGPFTVRYDSSGLRTIELIVRDSCLQYDTVRKEIDISVYNDTIEKMNVLDSIKGSSYITENGVASYEVDSIAGMEYFWYIRFNGNIIEKNNHKITVRFFQDPVELNVYARKPTCIKTNKLSKNISIVASNVNKVPSNLPKIYPNPTDKQIHFKNLKNRIKNITITDITGKIIREKNNIQSNTVNISKLKRGIYIFQIKTGNKTFRRKIIKK